MSVVVSDTSPLHYLILCGADGVLARLFDRVLIPPTVFAELQHPNTPAVVGLDTGAARLGGSAHAHRARSLAECGYRRARGDLPSAKFMPPPC